MIPQVLVVDEDGPFAAALVSKLRERKISAFTTNGEQEAVERAAAHAIDVVLLDIRNQGKAALEILHSIKQLRPAVEFILLSSGQSVVWSMAGMRAGAFDDISVPLDIDRLARKIREAWKRSRAKSKRKRSLAQMFGDAMVAATFAQAGELTTAEEILARSAADGKSEDSPAAGDPPGTKEIPAKLRGKSKSGPK